MRLARAWGVAPDYFFNRSQTFINSAIAIINAERDSEEGYRGR